MNLEELATNPIEHHEVFYQSAEFWVGIAFVLVICGLFMPVKKAVSNILKQRIAQIKKDLQEAENLKLEAQALYAEYERRLINKDNEVAQIIDEQEAFIADIKDQKTKELNAFLNQKKLEVDHKIELAIETAEAEIRNKISDKVIDTLSIVLKNKLDKNLYDKLIESSINNIK